jgi:hypothetical protein
MEQSARYHFNQHDLNSALWVLIHALIATFVATALQLAGHFDFGAYQPMVVILLAFVSANVKQILAGPSCTSQTASLSVTTTTPATAETTPATPAAVPPLATPEAENATP